MFERQQRRRSLFLHKGEPKRVLRPAGPGSETGVGDWGQGVQVSLQGACKSSV